MDDRDVIDIGLRIIKRCGMYAEEYKNWIARENETPPIVKTIDSFKEYWAAAISLVNQTSIPAANQMALGRLAHSWFPVGRILVVGLSSSELLPSLLSQL
jgi:hypothetical protein